MPSVLHRRYWIAFAHCSSKMFNGKTMPENIRLDTSSCENLVISRYMLVAFFTFTYYTIKRVRLDTQKHDCYNVWPNFGRITQVLEIKLDA